MEFEIIDSRSTHKYRAWALTILTRAFCWLWIPAAILITMIARGGLDRLIAEQIGLHPVYNRDMNDLAHIIGYIMLWTGFIGYCIILVCFSWMLFFMGVHLFG